MKVKDKPLIKNVSVIVNVSDCHDCPHFSRGFLSEPNECGYFEKAHEYFTPRQGIADFCPYLDDAKAKDIKLKDLSLSVVDYMKARIEEEYGKSKR